MMIVVDAYCPVTARVLAEGLGDGWERETGGAALGNVLRKDGLSITVRVACVGEARQWVLEGNVAIAHPVHGAFWLSEQEKQGMKLSHEVRVTCGGGSDGIVRAARRKLLPPLEAAHAAYLEWVQALDHLQGTREGQLSALLQAGASAGAWLADGTPSRPADAKTPDRVRIEGIGSPDQLAWAEFQHAGHTGSGQFTATLEYLPAPLAARVMAVLAEWKQGTGQEAAEQDAAGAEGWKHYSPADLESDSFGPDDQEGWEHYSPADLESDSFGPAGGDEVSSGES